MILASIFSCLSAPYHVFGRCKRYSRSQNEDLSFNRVSRRVWDHCRAIATCATDPGKLYREGSLSGNPLNYFGTDLGAWVVDERSIGEDANFRSHIPLLPRKAADFKHYFE